MAYYDRFNDKKPRSKRDDLRDDTLTHRPARDGRPEGARGFRSDRPAFREDRAEGARGFRSDRPAFREDRAEGGRGFRSDRPAFREDRADRPSRGPRPERRFPREEAQPEAQENLLVGRNPIREALKSGRDLEKLLVAKGELMGSGREIVAIARERQVIVQEVARERLDAMAPGHQGMIAVASAYAYSTLEDMLALAKARGEAPFLVILDGVTDPHNLGAIIRSAECAGAHGVIVPERRAVGLTPAAVKASAGAVEHIPVARETNIARTLERLKREGIWVFGADMAGTDYRQADFSGPAALVIGSEGEGISRLVREHCDVIVSLPMRGKIESLNASVAAGVLLYAMAAARGK